jgi:hypothetical protein
MVEVADLFAQDEVFQRGRAAQADLQRVLVVGNRHTLVGGQVAVGRVHAHAVERGDGRVLALRRVAAADFVRAGDLAAGAAGGGVGRRLVMLTLERDSGVGSDGPAMVLSTEPAPSVEATGFFLEGICILADWLIDCVWYQHTP